MRSRDRGAFGPFDVGEERVKSWFFDVERFGGVGAELRTVLVRDLSLDRRSEPPPPPES